jgi:hypothetical protein
MRLDIILALLDGIADKLISIGRGALFYLVFGFSDPFLVGLKFFGIVIGIKILVLLHF